MVPFAVPLLDRSTSPQLLMTVLLTIPPEETKRNESSLTVVLFAVPPFITNMFWAFRVMLLEVTPEFTEMSAMVSAPFKFWIYMLCCFEFRIGD